MIYFGLSFNLFLFCTISIVALQFFVVPYNVKAIDNSVKIYYNNLVDFSEEPILRYE